MSLAAKIFYKMWFYSVLMLLLCWSSTQGAEQIESNEAIDQFATASENIALPYTKSREHDSKIVSSTILPELEETTKIHYENSNGFVPMITSPNNRKDKSLSDKQNSSSALVDASDSPSLRNHSENPLVNDPTFSTEARMLFNLAKPGSIRRSFDSQEGQKEFEILKVNGQTPAIANYHEFYENMQSNLGRGGDTRPSDSGRNVVNSMRTKDRIKQIEDYLSYGVNQQRENIHSLPQYYSQANSGDIVPTKLTFEPEKVHNNYPQREVSDYKNFGGSITRHKTPSLPTTNYASSDSSKTTKKNPPIKSRQHTSQPVVVVEPSDYKVGVNYDNNQHSSVVFLSSDSKKNQQYQNSESEDRYDRDENYSDDNSDYSDISERPRRLHKSRRRPHHSDSSKKLLKEHRGQSFDDTRGSEDSKKINSSSRSKLHRSRAKPNYWTDDNNHSLEQSSDDNSGKEKLSEEIDEEKNRDQPGVSGNQDTWNQLGPNIEFSQSSGFELNQINKPNLLVPVNLNLVPLTHFDHATALGNSQGFDITNAGIPSYVTAGSIVSTASPLISSSPSVLIPSYSSQNAAKNYAYSTSVPDIIVGQNTYQSPVQAVLLPQMNVQDKYSPNLKTQYFQSTVAPMFAITQNLNPSSQPTLQTFLQTPGNTNGNYNILVNTRGLHGQNQQPTTQNNNDEDNVPKKTENQSKKNTFNRSNGQFLASASLSVGQGSQSQNNQQSSTNANNNMFDSSQTDPQVSKPQSHTKTYIPTFLQTGNGISTVNANQMAKDQNQQQFLNVGNNIFQNTWKQLQQLQTQQDPNRNFGIPYQTFYGNSDSLGSTSNDNANTYNAIQNANGGGRKAQLPVVGMQTVEIRNPNINLKPSPVDVTAINPFATINQYPAAVLTTPIPIFSTTANFVNPRPILTSASPESISIQSYVDSLTQFGAQNNQGQYQPADRPTFNPMNFVPSVDLVKSQSMLNNKVHIPESLPQHLNLVPMVPGGNFFKHSPSAQVELITKPKLSADLEKYAEEMFRESLRTIYNTHKWNSDKKVRNLTSADLAELERLSRELERIKASMTGSKNIKEILEAHHSETKLRTVDPGSSNKRPGLSIAAIEELFKSDFKPAASSDSYQNIHSRPGKTEVTELTDYLTPPKLNSFVSKSPFSDGKLTKKRPGSKGPRHEKGKPRPHTRHNNHATHSAGLETAASSHVRYPYRRPNYDRENGGRQDSSYENYPTFTTSSPDGSIYEIPTDYKSKKDSLDMNLPRTHNLLGLLMKNKKLPSRGSSNFFRDEDEVMKFIEEEKKRAEIQFYEETMSKFQKKSDLQPQITSQNYHNKHQL